MNYPVWDIPSFGTHLLMALVAIIHVYVAHFAIGGGLFLVVTEAKGHRENDKGILEYVRSHARMFLLISMVFGAITGVGIWFTISVISPGATSTLIHSFVFGWATEWVFFVGEIVALFVYVYTFGKLDKRRHMRLGWFYFVFAWLSLFVINGIITVMLTPGGWLEDQNFWSGFFNPTMWPSLVFRTLLCFMIAGLFGFFTATRLKDRDLSTRMARYCALWLVIPLLLLGGAGYWYLSAMPEGTRSFVMGGSPEIPMLLHGLALSIPILLLGAVLMTLRLPPAPRKVLAVLLVLAGLLYMGSFEWIREAARRPFLIPGHTYSNSLRPDQLEEANEKGFLATARWTEIKEVTEENRLAAGRELFRHQCQACHTIGGITKDILPLTEKYSVFGMVAAIDGLGEMRPYMPPFAGNTAERDALAAYIVEGLHGRTGEEGAGLLEIKQLEMEPSPFAADDKYVLLAWAGGGMRCNSDTESNFLLTAPGMTLGAQLIERGESPTLVTDGVELTYRPVNEVFASPEKTAEFWKHAETLLGKDLDPGIGTAGKGVTGSMDRVDGGVFLAKAIPVYPYGTDGSYLPYPVFEVEARMAGVEKPLAVTRVVLPTSTEMGCRNCHGGGWRVNGVAGVSDETARDILTVHDDIEGTDLAASAARGEPKACASCHSESEGEAMSMSASIHGWHVHYLESRGEEACASCHPSSPNGATRCLRGVHDGAGLDCTSCHGFMEDHALSLLKGEEARGRVEAARLMKGLEPRSVERVDDVKGRLAWANEPDCLNCHVDFESPETDTAFNHWVGSFKDLYRARADDAGVRCIACHGAPHAVYPAQNPYGADRDNLVPLQYQKGAAPIGEGGRCVICHGRQMYESIHHANIELPPDPSVGDAGVQQDSE